MVWSWPILGTVLRFFQGAEENYKKLRIASFPVKINV